MKFQIYKDKKGEFRWRLISKRTKKIVADSGEGYKEKRFLLRAIKSIQKSVQAATLEDIIPS
jgi:uncharacterized protein YegP (UPF0339 family)